MTNFDGINTETYNVRCLKPLWFITYSLNQQLLGWLELVLIATFLTPEIVSMEQAWPFPKQAGLPQLVEQWLASLSQTACDELLRFENEMNFGDPFKTTSMATYNSLNLGPHKSNKIYSICLLEWVLQ
jgi:hypothetical protein